MGIVIHTLIPSDSGLANKDFYQALFPDWNFHYQGPNEFWEITTQGQTPADNRVFVAMIAGGQAPPQPMNYYAVDDIDATLARCAPLGGKVVVPKTATPGVGYFASCLDVNGQSFGLWQDDKSAR